MIDAHHHIWLQKDLPWLLGPEQPRIFGAYGKIKRDYLIDEFKKDLKSTGIEKSVYVQANWAPNWAADEAAWVQSVSDNEGDGWPHAIVAYADFTVDDVRPQLEKLSKYKLVRGIRQQMHWHENPLYKFASRPDLLVDEKVVKNISYLADYNWVFDLQVFASQMSNAVDLVKQCPDVQFILQHAGMLEDRSDEGYARWFDGMKKLSKCKNVNIKLSGLGTFKRKNDPKFIGETVETMAGMFGAKRCMFGSNFPIEKIWTSYTKLFEAYQSAASNLSKGQQKAIFEGTAARIYRI